MAKAKKKKTGQLGLKMGLKDERLPKLAGLLLCATAVYLFVAFLSYLFTWKIDQDRVIHAGWSFLFYERHAVDNWLGRLGAFVSSGFMYWLFGLPSFLFAYFVWRLGLNRLRRQPLKLMGTLFVKVVLIMLALSILLYLVFNALTEFPIGGGVGRNIVDYLSGVLGTPGVILLLIVLFGLYLIFEVRLDFNASPREMQSEIVDHFSERIRFRGKARPKRFEPKKKDNEGPPALAPASAPRKKKPPTVPLAPGDGSAFEIDGPELPSKQGIEHPTGKQAEMPLESVGDLTLVSPDPLAVGANNLTIADGDQGINTDLAVTEENKDHKEPYDPTLDLPAYEKPHMQLLIDRESGKAEVDRAELEANKDQIIETLLNYKIEITKIRATIGPTVTLYEIVPAPGVRISKIKNLEDDIALSLAALGIRIIAPIPGRGTIGIEVPNKKPQMVSMREVIESEKFRSAKMDLPLALGKTIKNEVLVADLAKMPHLLVAGATGQGKSVGINSIVMSLLYKKHPSQVKLVMIDPKKVELFPYAKLE
ncbi:MAG: DNA translocase FtsK 4TM domain-containing protein, partial [Bacteroidota bacterium]